MDPTAAVATLSDLLLRKENLMLMAAVWVLLDTARRLLPPKTVASAGFVRALPVLPLVLCSAGVWIPTMMPEGIAPIERVLSGLILGYACDSNKLWRQSVLGKGVAKEKPHTLEPLP